MLTDDESKIKVTSLRELDALVAEKVTEFVVWPEGHELIPASYSHTRTDLVPHYSTSIADAWQVVEEVSRQHEIYVSGYKDRWEATVVRLKIECTHCSSHSHEYIDAEAETAPLAICLAALKAVGVEVEYES